MSATQPDIIRLALEARAFVSVDEDGKFPPTIIMDQSRLERFATLAIADFLQRTGQYVTNDASRESAIAQSAADEREACAQVCDDLQTGMDWQDRDLIEAAAAIRARGTPETDTQAVSKSA